MAVSQQTINDFIYYFVRMKTARHPPKCDRAWVLDNKTSYLISEKSREKLEMFRITSKVTSLFFNKVTMVAV